MPAEKLVAFVLGYAPTRPGFRQGCVVSCDASVLARPGAAGLNSRPAVLGWIIAEPGMPLTRRPRRARPRSTSCRYPSTTATSAVGRAARKAGAAWQPLGLERRRILVSQQNCA